MAHDASFQQRYTEQVAILQDLYDHHRIDWLDAYGVLEAIRRTEAFERGETPR
jgi:hypothetical protein